MQYTAEETYTPVNHEADRERKEVKFETNETQQLAIAVVGLAALGWSGEEIVTAANEVAEQAASGDDLYLITGHHGDYDVCICPV